MIHRKFLKPVAALLFAATVISVLPACSKQKEDELIAVDAADNTINYELVPTQRGDVVKTKKLSCVYKKNEEQEVFFPVSGKLVDRVYVREGDSVKKGDLLAELSSGNLSREIERLEYQIKKNTLLSGYADEEQNIDLQVAWLDYLYGTGQSSADKERLDKRLENLNKSTQSKKESYADTLEFDKKKLAQLKKEYSESRIYAAFDGTVKFIEDHLEGSTSNIETRVMTIVDNEEGYFETSEVYNPDLFPEGVPVNMTISVGTAKGDYALLPLDRDNWDKTMKFSVYIGDADNITADTRGEIKISEASSENVLYVPKRCVYQAGEQYYVYIVNEDGFREVLYVETGLFGDDRVEITGGLNEGDMVIKR